MERISDTISFLWLKAAMRDVSVVPQPSALHLNHGLW